MKWLEICGDCFVNGDPVATGAIIFVDDATAKQLTTIGRAIAAVEPVPTNQGCPVRPPAPQSTPKAQAVKPNSIKED
jgi:hypothetical protein